MNKRLPLPESGFNLGEWLQGHFMGTRPYAWGRRLLTGSNSESFVDAHYFTAEKVIVGDKINTRVRGRSNPEAGFLPRSWTRAIVLGIGASAINGLKQQIA